MLRIILVLFALTSANRAFGIEDVRQHRFYPLALRQITSGQAQPPLIGLEWDMLSAEQKRGVEATVAYMVRDEQILEDRIQFTENLIERFSQTTLESKNFDAHQAVLPNFQENHVPDRFAYIQLPPKRREYIKNIAVALAHVVARLDDTDINKDDLRALAARLLIEFELALHFTTGQPELVAQETIKVWFGGMLAGFGLSSLSTLDPTHTLMFAGGGLTLASLIAIIWNVQARDEMAWPPLANLPGANERAAVKVRRRLREHFWTDVQMELMINVSVFKWGRGQVPAKDFPATIFSLIEGPRADLNKIDCRAILSKPLLKH